MMLYDCNIFYDIIFYATEDTPVVIFWKSVWETFSESSPKKHQLVFTAATQLFQEPTLHCLLLGFPWCNWATKPCHLLSLLKTRAEIAWTSLFANQNSQLFGVNKPREEKKKNLWRDFSGQGFNFHWDHNLPGWDKWTCWRWLDTNQILQTTRSLHCFLSLIFLRL